MAQIAESESKALTPVPPIEPPVEETSRVQVAGQWTLMWWKFRRHHLAMISLILLIIIYIITFIPGFFAPYETSHYNSSYLYAPPQTLYLFDDQGQFRPHVLGYKSELDPVSFRRTFTEDPDTIIPLGFFVRGDPYKIGLHRLPIPQLNRLYIELDIHLFGPLEPGQPFYWLGTDQLGRDILSRILYATQISMSLSLMGVFLSVGIGVILGGLSGLVGGWVDNLIQRWIEIFMTIPTLPLWMAIGASIPPTYDPVQVYLMITVILSFIGWTGMARVVRSRFLALREEEFVMAAELDGVGRIRIITHHLMPSFLSHIIASITLGIPYMILGETALSFLGFGLRQPVVSWGVLLQDAQSINIIANAPWLLAPGLAVVLTVLALNFLGDGLRDAADPYH